MNIIMKKVVRLKIKHIVLISSITFFLAMIIYSLIPSIMLKIGDRFNYNGDLLTAKSYYDKIDKHFPTSAVAENALEKAGYISATNNKIIISSLGFGSTHHSSAYLLPDTRVYYEEMTNRFSGFPAKRIRYDLLSNDVREKIDNGDIKEAIDMIKSFYTKINNEEQKYIDSFTIKGIIKAFEVKGYYNEAEELTSWIIKYDDEWEKAEFENLLEELKKSKYAHGKVAGKVTLQNQPFKDLPIFLQYQDTKDGTMHGFTDEAFWAKTDEDGNFEFSNVPEGRYTIGVVTDLEQIEDKILKGNPFKDHSFNVVTGENYNFEIDFVNKMKVIAPANGEEIKEDTIKFLWEPLDGTAYYSITFGISFNGATGYRDLGEKYYTTEALIKKEDILYMDSFLSFDEKGPIPESFLAYTNPKVQLFWGVNAYDENDNMLSSSNGYVKKNDTDFSLGQREVTEGDKKLLKRDYKAAIESYEKTLEKNPEDIHSLLMLARLYDFDEEHSSYPYTNKEKSKSYYKRLYEITNNEIFLEKF